MNIPTLEEFIEEVKRNFLTCSKLSKQEAENFIRSEEAMKEIVNRYNSDIERIKNGTLTPDSLMRGGASSVGFCLSYMY